MRKAKKTRAGAVPTPRDGFPNAWSGVILERLRRLNGLPLHKLDWQTEYFIHHVLGSKKRV